MADNKTDHERRKHPRLGQTVPIKICQKDGDVVTDTVNISRTGVYCRTDRPIAPMTKLKVHLLLPAAKKGGKSTTKKITCQGVVVRSEPIAVDKKCHVAIFFNDISSKDAESIGQYVAQQIKTQSKD